MSDPWCDVTTNPQGEIVRADSEDGRVVVRNVTTGARWEQGVPTDFLRYLRVAATSSAECAIGVGADDWAYVVMRGFANRYRKVTGQDAVAIVALPNGTFVPYAMVTSRSYLRGFEERPVPPHLFAQGTSQGIREVLPDETVHFGDDFLLPASFGGHFIWRRTEKLGWVVGQLQDGIAAFEVATGRFFSVVRGLRVVEGVHFTLTPGGTLVVCAATNHGPYHRQIPPPYPPHEPPAPPLSFGPRSEPLPHDGRVYDLLQFILGDPSTWPRKGPTHPMNQVVGKNGIFHFVKFGDAISDPGSAYETWAYDEHWLYQLEDASSRPDHLTDPRWFPRHMPIGEEHAFVSGPHERVFLARGTCREEAREPVNRRMWVNAIYPAFDCGPDLGIREVMEIAYDPTAGFHGPTRAIELGWYARGAGSLRWGSYRSDALYPPGATRAQFADGARLFPFSDFYLVGGPNTQPKLTGCVPLIVPHAHPEQEPDPMQPVVTLHDWIHVEYPQLVQAYRDTHGGAEPSHEWAAFQTYRRYLEPNVWTFPKMLAWEKSQGTGTEPDPQEPP